MMRAHRLALLAVSLLVSLSAVPAQAQDGAFGHGRTLTRWLLAGHIDSLQAVVSPQFSKAVGGRAGLAHFVDQIGSRAGKETALIKEAGFREGGLTTYYRVSRFERIPSVTAKWVWNDDGAVVGATVTPTPEPAPSEYLGYETKTPLRLPFGVPAGGTWYVAWGGRDAIHNYHVVAPDQRFAYDFVIVHGDSLHTGSGERNEDYYCWGTPVYAPAAGRIVTAVDSVNDNARPGEMNAKAPPGNYVVIDHGNGEYSLIAHFRRGSVAVREGDKVTAATLLGVCGNSGNSSLPHVHYHLQTGPRYRDGVGLPASFNGYFVGGAYVERGEPIRGQMIVPYHSR